MEVIKMGGAIGATANLTVQSSLGGAIIGVAEAAPLTGGASLVVAAGGLVVAGVWSVASSLVIYLAISSGLKAIEKEIKLKWEIERANQEINDLQNEFDQEVSNLEQEIENEQGHHIAGVEAIGRCYRRVLEEKEERLRDLKRELCRVVGCRRYPNCIHGQNN